MQGLSNITVNINIVGNPFPVAPFSNLLIIDKIIYVVF